MKAEVQWSQQVQHFIGSLAPESKKKLRAGVRALAHDKGDIKPLVDDLIGYNRLRVGDFRVIYREHSNTGWPCGNAFLLSAVMSFTRSSLV